MDSNAIRAEATQWARGMVERLDNYVGRISSTKDKTKKELSTQGPGSAPSGATDTDSREFDE